MKLPHAPPDLAGLMDSLLAGTPELMHRVMLLGSASGADRYLHWDELRHRPPPEGVSAEHWWVAVKLARRPGRRSLPILDCGGREFGYNLPDIIMRLLHELDQNASGRIEADEQVTSPELRDRYLIRSLAEEGITSSQLEGATTTTPVALEMIRSRRPPRDRSERMILNNVQAMRRIRELGDSELSPHHVLELHGIVTAGTLERDEYAGRLRRANVPAEAVAVVDPVDGSVLHTPPDASELEGRVERMCEFANGRSPEGFLHPVVRAVALHFWLAYDHPFMDGNGRTARALFYWAMLRQGYWLAEFISISNIIKRAPAQYGRAFLHTETDDNDLTYFLIHQLQVIRKAIDVLRDYLALKASEVRELTGLVGRSAEFNHRQLAVLGHAVRHPGFRYTIRSHQNSHGVAYETARSDLLRLAERGVLEQSKAGKAFVFMAPPDIHQRLKRA